MKRVYSSPNTMMVGLIKGLLETNGIDCLIKNQILAGGIGELPLNECWPEVWITDDDDLPRATELVELALSSPENPPSSWRCRCGEEIEGQFELCWHCGRERPPRV